MCLGCRVKLNSFVILTNKFEKDKLSITFGTFINFLWIIGSINLLGIKNNIFYRLISHHFNKFSLETIKINVQIRTAP